MQIKSPELWIVLFITLTGCTTDRLEEESFGLPGGTYPRLVEVPDRPSVPLEKEIQKTQEQLELARELAEQAVKDSKVSS